MVDVSTLHLCESGRVSDFLLTMTVGNFLSCLPGFLVPPLRSSAPAVCGAVSGARAGAGAAGQELAGYDRRVTGNDPAGSCPP